MWDRVHEMGRSKDSSGFVFSVQLLTLAGMGRVNMPVDSFCMSCELRFIGWDGVQIPVDLFY